MSTQLSDNVAEILRQKNQYIKPENLKTGVTAFGVTGAVEPKKSEQEKTVNPSTSSVDVLPDTNYVLSKVTVNAVDNTIDANIIPTNIRAGVSVLGVEGNLEPDKPDQSKTVTPTTSEQVVYADTGYELAQVTVEAVDNTIDSNIVAENIKDGVSILGITGTLQEGEMALEEYNNALDLSEQLLGVTPISQQEASQVGPVLNNILGATEPNDAGGYEEDVEPILDDILGGVN